MLCRTCYTIDMIGRLVMYLQANIWYSLVILILSIVSVAMLVYEVFASSATPELIAQLQRFDIIIAWIFLTDFFMGLLFNTSIPKRIYWRHNWLNLISSIPVTSDITRILRIVRVLRAFRVIRAGLNFWFARSRWQRNRRGV